MIIHLVSLAHMQEHLFLLTYSQYILRTFKICTWYSPEFGGKTGALLHIHKRGINKSIVDKYAC